MRTAFVALAGAAGALSRYGIGLAVGVRSFPWATLGINSIGSFLLGVVLTLGVERSWSANVTVPLAVGFLGAFTTFSTFSWETYTLLRTERAVLAAAYVSASFALGVAGAALGYLTARLVGGRG